LSKSCFRLLSRVVILLVIASMLLTGCGGQTTTGGSEDKMEIKIASGADPINMDPRKTWVGPGYSINAHILEPLVFREEVDGSVQLYGVLAENWEQRDDVTWVFNLREGVQFHNGEPFTAEAVKFTIESIMDPEFITPLKTWLSDVEKVETEGDYTVVITTKYPTRGLLSSLAQVSIVEPKAVGEMGADYNLLPVGTGPYKIVSYTPNNQVVVERFADYWGEPGKPDKITFRIMPENATRLAALESGEVLLAEGMPPDKLGTIRNNPGLDVAYTPTLRVDFIVIQHDRPWMNNLKFRQAMSYAIDRESIVNNILGGATVVANSPSPPGTIGYNAELPPLEYNPEKAKQLMAEAGYNGEPIIFGAPIGRYAMDKQVGEAIAGMLIEAGINSSFSAEPPPVVL
jgi:peptide/nickel transport system substrate-binding protein